MQNENIRNALLNRNMQAAPRQQIQPNENNINKEKEKYVRSQKILNRSNHVYYNSNKDLEITKKSSCNNEIDNDYIDHPQPLISENEEDLEELKAQFIKKEETKEKETTKGVGDVNSNVENTKKTKGADHVEETKTGSLIIEKTVEENKNTKKIDLLCRKRSENIMPLKKKYKYETIPISSIKAHAYFKLNNVNKNSDFNTDKKEEEKSELIYVQNTLNKELNNNSKKSSCQNSSLNILIENNNKRNILKRIKTEKENCNYLNISNDNNQNINNKNFVKKSRTLYDNNQNNYLYNNQKRRVNNGNIKKENIAKEEESIKNNFKSKNMNIIQNNKKIISQFQEKNFVLRNRKPINIKNIYNSIPIDNFQTLTSDRESQSNKIGLDEKTKNRIEGNNALYLSKIKSDEIKASNFQKKQKSLFNMKTANDNNAQRYRKKTFDKGGKFNNVQTTYIVISKNQNTNKIPKVNTYPEIIDSNKYKFFNPTPSANCINFTKLNNTENISLNYPTEFENGRITVNEPRIYIPNRSQNYLPIKRAINYSDFTFNKNNYDTNYKNYIESTNFRSRDILKDIVGRNTCCFINKSSNINQNTIPLYNYNYDYFYGYNDNNHFPNNSYLQYTINTEY